MPQFVIRIILKPHSRRRRPLRMFLSNSFLRHTLHLDLLPLPQLANHRSQPRFICNDRVAHPLIRPGFYDDQVPRIHLHDLVSRTFRAHLERDRAILAVLVAVAVAGVEDVFNLLGVQGNETQAVGDELISQDGGIGFDLDEVDRHGGYFGKDSAPQGVGEGEVRVGKDEIYEVRAGLV